MAFELPNRIPRAELKLDSGQRLGVVISSLSAAQWALFELIWPKSLEDELETLEIRIESIV